MSCRLATFIPTIYSIIVYRRHLKYNDYQHPVNAKSYGFSSPPKISTPPNHSRLELGDGFYTDGFETSYPSQTSTMSSSRSRSGSCHKPAGGAVVANRTRSLLSVRSDRRVSSGGSSILTMLDTSGGNGGRDSPDLANTRAAAASPLSPYSHERSTEFEEYVKRRSKVSAGGGDGYSTTPDALSPAAAGTRCVSWASSRGLTPVPEGQEASSDGNGNGGGAYSSYSPYRSGSISVSIASAISPPGSPLNAPAGFGAAPLPYATYGSQRNRSGSDESDRTGLLANSEDIGNQSMSRRS